VCQREQLVHLDAGHRRRCASAARDGDPFGFLARYAEDSGRRLERLQATNEAWWEETTTFFDSQRSRAWVMVRRLAHTAHHRGQQMAMLRMLGREIHSNYGPTADTGGLAQNGGATIYAYSSLPALLQSESRHGAKAPLPAATGRPVTERPGTPDVRI
jgi:hypothetical protein